MELTGKQSHNISLFTFHIVPPDQMEQLGEWKLRLFVFFLVCLSILNYWNPSITELQHPELDTADGFWDFLEGKKAGNIAPRGTNLTTCFCFLMLFVSD